jgi:hypothetical protein
MAEPINLAGTRTVRRASSAPREIAADICVLGAGIAGISAAIEAARLGRRVVLVDAAPSLGGQAVGAIIATFCGLFSNGTHGYQLTRGIADDILDSLAGQDGALHYRHGPHTVVVYYDEIALARWVETTIQALGITTLLGATLREASRAGNRVEALHCATRYGDISVRAAGFVDASGDAALAWHAGFDCREPDGARVFGTQMVVVENIIEAAAPSREALAAAMAEHGEAFGVRRREGLAFIIPGRAVAALNVTHTETPLDPLAASAAALEGRDQADRAVALLRHAFPDCFGPARIRAYGTPGIRQTRWIAAEHQLTAAEVIAGTQFPDAIARTAWPIELHDHASGHHWHVFDRDHIHYIPLRSLIPAGADNLIAAGRCIDADLAALSSVRVMGPCIATGAAAAHALDLAGAGSLQQIDTAALTSRLHENISGKHWRWPEQEE